MRIIPLPHNPVPVYYPGGKQIRVYRDVGDDVDLISPEDWLGSTTVLRSPVDGEESVAVGHSIVADGRNLLDVLNDDPESWTGSPEPVTVNFLVKLLNPAERIAVHWHPDADFARNHLGMAHGKAEAWIVLSSSAKVWLGLLPDVGVDDFEAAIATQDVPWMLDHMHVLELVEGDTVFVPPGLVHAIDEGALMVEVQEPTSVSILAEHARLGVGSFNASLRAGWPAALQCLAAPSARKTVERLIGRVPETSGQTLMMPAESHSYFRCWVLNGDGAVTFNTEALSVVLVDRGDVRFEDLDSGQTTLARKGSAWLFGVSANPITVEGKGRLLIFSGPASDESGAESR